MILECSLKRQGVRVIVTIALADGASGSYFERRELQFEHIRSEQVSARTIGSIASAMIRRRLGIAGGHAEPKTVRPRDPNRRIALLAMIGSRRHTTRKTPATLFLSRKRRSRVLIERVRCRRRNLGAAGSRAVWMASDESSPMSSAATAAASEAELP